MSPEAPTKKRSLHVLQLLFGVIVLAGIAFLAFRERSVWHQFLTVLHHFNPTRLPWLLLALLAEAASFVCYALVQQALLAEGGAELSLSDMVQLAIAATGLTNLVPGGTAPASGWLVAQYKKRDIPLPLALWAVLAGGVAAAISVLSLTLLGAIIAGLLPWWASVVCAVALSAGSITVIIGFRQLRALRTWSEHTSIGPVGRFLHNVTSKVGDASTFRAPPALSVRVMLLSIGNWGLDVTCLAAAFALLGLGVPWRTLLFAYAMAQVAGSLAPVPAGIGFVEGGMVGAFALAGTPVGGAILATVLYRLITTIGIAGAGTLMLVHLSRKKPIRHARLSGRASAMAKR
jgi:hypothetical protein